MHGSAVHHKGMQHLLREKGVRVSELDFVRAQVSPKLFHTCVGEVGSTSVQVIAELRTLGLERVLTSRPASSWIVARKDAAAVAHWKTKRHLQE